MRIACIGLSKIPANTANSMQTMKVCHALAQGGAEVRLWAPGRAENPGWPALAAYYGLGGGQPTLEVNWLPSARVLHRLDYSLGALGAAWRWQADAVYTWLIQAAVFALSLGFPVIYEMHDRPTGSFGPSWLRRFARLPGRKRVLFITRALRQKTAEEFGVGFADNEVQIAPNGVELERYAKIPAPAAARRQLNLPERLTAVYTGHFYAGRGMDVLWSLAQAFPQVNFLWVGGRAPDVQLWQEKARLAGLENLTLTGFVENARLPLYQAAAEIALMPYERSIAGSSGGNSADICSPMKMFEYMAAGRAILSSDLPVIAEVLNARNAAFAAPEDPADWARAFAGLLADAARRENLGVQARQDVVEYTWRARAKPVLSWLEGREP